MREPVYRDAVSLRIEQADRKSKKEREREGYRKRIRETVYRDAVSLRSEQADRKSKKERDKETERE